MSHRVRHLALALIVLAAATPLLADDLAGADDMLCTAVEATRCESTGECTTAPPWTLNIPQFIEVNLAEKKLSTTPASGENRSTPIKNVERAEGFIYVQGVEAGRAFSFVIAEETGKASIAVARDGLAVAVFGACTPLPVKP